LEITATDAVDWPVNIMLTPLPYGVMAILFIDCMACKLMWEEETTFDCCQQQEIGGNLCFRKITVGYKLLHTVPELPLPCLLPLLFTDIEFAKFSQKEFYFFSLNILRNIFHSGIFSEFRWRCGQIGKLSLHVKW